jgi:F-type H+-transporting ATPase subunit gamma
LIGNKASNFFERHGAKVKAHVSGLGDNPSVNDLIGSVKVMLKAYDNGEIDGCIWCTTSSSTPWFSNQSRSTAAFARNRRQQARQKHHWDYLYEPDPSNCWIPC